MPVVTNAPIQIQANPPGPNYRQSATEINPFQFKVGVNLYQLLVSDTDQRFDIFKSTDSGTTWTITDSADSPDVGAISTNLVAYFNSGTGVIAVAYLDSGLTALKIVEFATGADTWGTPTAAVTVSSDSQAFFFYQKSGTDYVVIGSTSTHLYRIINSAGVWGSVTNILAATTQVECGVVDASDNGDFFEVEGHQVVYYQLDASNVLSSPTNLSEGIKFLFANRPTCVLVDADTIAIAYITQSNTVNVSIGTPLSAPTFTDYVIDTLTGSESFGYPTLFIDKDGALNVFYVLVDYGTMPIVDELMQSVFDGAIWSSPIVFYDEIANPPADSVADQNDQEIHTLDVAQFSDGSWAISTTLETIDPDNPASNLCTGFELTASPPTQSLQLIKTVSGGSAVPAMWLLTGTGTSQTVSGAGDTGVVAVTDPQTFQLAESASPDGYTAGAWDCGAAVMPSPTSVIVDDSGGTTISAVQVSADPTFKTMLSGGDSQFTVGSDQYRVLVNSSNRLGMFKRATASVGGSWTEMDSSHAPTGQSGYGHSLVSSTTIAVCYLPTGNTTAKIVEFNTGTDLWGTPTAALTLPSSLATFAFVRRSDNVYVIVAAWSGRLYYATNTTGTWSAIINVLNPGGVVLNGVIDSSDRIWFNFNSTSITVLLYQLSASFVLSSSFTTTTVLFPGLPFPYIYYPQIGLWSTDAVAVAYNTAATIGGAGFIRVKIATPLSAPVVTSYDVYTVPAGTERDFLMQPMDDGSGNLNLFFAHTDTGVNRVLQSTFDGVSTWSAPATFYDAFADPPPFGASPYDISALQGKKLGSGWTAATTMQTSGPTSTGEFIESVTPTGVVVCTITNTFASPGFAASCPSPVYIVGTPYDSFVTVTGGVAPFTFAVTSGSLPTGLSLDASTGEITGTPVDDGPFTFVITVTDHDGNTTTTGSCSAGRCPGTISLI